MSQTQNQTTNKSQTKNQIITQVTNSNPQLLNHQEQISQNQTHEERKIFTNSDPRSKNFTNSDPRRTELIGQRQAVKPTGGIRIWHLWWVLIRSLGVLGGPIRPTAINSMTYAYESRPMNPDPQNQITPPDHRRTLTIGKEKREVRVSEIFFFFTIRL